MLTGRAHLAKDTYMAKLARHEIRMYCVEMIYFGYIRRYLLRFLLANVVVHMFES